MEENLMKRLAAVLAAAAFGTAGCHSQAPRQTPTGGMDISWSFLRTLNDANSTQLAYTCAQAGIDTVVVTAGGGSVTLPCADNVGDGGAIAIGAGTYDVLLDGFRGNVRLFNGQVNGVTVVANQVTVVGQANPVALDARFAPLQINALFKGLSGADFVPNTCQAAGVDTISVHLVDHAGTSVYNSGNLGCTGPFGLIFDAAVPGSVGPVDLDSYTIRIVATGASFDFDSAVPPGCTSPVFNHFGSDVGGFSWNVPVFEVTTLATLCN